LNASSEKGTRIRMSAEDSKRYKDLHTPQNMQERAKRLGAYNNYDDMTRKMVKRMESVKKAAKFELGGEEAETRDAVYWRDFETTCTMCGNKRTHSRGYIFTGMAPEGEMKTFCNIACCEAWEQEGDNTNSRKAAILAQRARKEKG
jgi:hypothetical protein